MFHNDNVKSTLSSENNFHGDTFLALEFLLQFSYIPYHTFIWTTGKTTFTGFTEYGFLNNCWFLELFRWSRFFMPMPRANEPTDGRRCSKRFCLANIKIWGLGTGQVIKTDEFLEKIQNGPWSLPSFSENHIADFATKLWQKCVGSLWQDCCVLYDTISHEMHVV